MHAPTLLLLALRSAFASLFLLVANVTLSDIHTAGLDKHPDHPNFHPVPTSVAVAAENAHVHITGHDDHTHPGQSHEDTHADHTGEDDIRSNTLLPYHSDTPGTGVSGENAHVGAPGYGKPSFA